MRGEGLAVGEDGEVGVGLASGGGEVGRELLVVFGAAFFEGGILLLGLCEHVGGGLAVALPVGLKAALEIFDSEALGVGDEDVAGDGLSGGDVGGEDDGEVGGSGGWRAGHVHVVGFGEFAGFGEGFGCAPCGDGGGLLAFGDGQMEVAPVDAEVVSGAIERALFLRADVEDGEAVGLGAAPGDGLVGGVDGDAGIDIEADGDLVSDAVGRRDSPSQVGDRAREEGQILREGRGEKGEVEVESGGLEGVNGAGGVDLHGELLHRGEFAGIGAHEAVGLAVDADEADEGLLGSCPVAGVFGGEGVGHRPDAEVRVVGDERDGWWALLRECRRGNSEQEDGGSREWAAFGGRVACVWLFHRRSFCKGIRSGFTTESTESAEALAWIRQGGDMIAAGDE